MMNEGKSRELFCFHNYCPQGVSFKWFFIFNIILYIEYTVNSQSWL